VGDIPIISPGLDNKPKSLKEILGDFTDAPQEKLRMMDYYVALTDHILTLIKTAQTENDVRKNSFSYIIV